MRTAARLLLAVGIAVTPGYALACGPLKIAGTWAVQVEEERWDEYFPEGLTVVRDDCLFRIAPSGERGVATVEIRCGEDRLFASAREDFPGVASQHELVKQRGGRLEAADGTFLPAPNKCEWLLVDRADIDGGEYIVRFGAPDARGKMQMLQLSGDGRQDHHFGSTEPKVTTAAGILQ